MSLFAVRNAITLEEACNQALIDAIGTLRQVEPYRAATKHLCAHFGAGHPLTSIGTREIERYQVEALRRWSAGTVRLDLAFLSRVFRIAVKTGRARENPVKLVSVVKPPAPRRVKYGPIPQTAMAAAH